MNSRKPVSPDELDQLLRDALRARVGGQEPAHRVWHRIKGELEADKAPSRQLKMGWSPLVMQAALTLVLAVLGGVGLQTLLNPDGALVPTRVPLPPVTTVGVTTVYVEETSTSNLAASPPATVFSDERDVRLLRSLSKPGPSSPAETKPDGHPPLMVPPDAPPHPASREGRLLAAMLAPQPAIPADEGSRLVLGGPSPK